LIDLIKGETGRKKLPDVFFKRVSGNTRLRSDLKLTETLALQP
jgi:hypothetical protein